MRIELSHFVVCRRKKNTLPASWAGTERDLQPRRLQISLGGSPLSIASVAKVKKGAREYQGARGRNVTTPCHRSQIAKPPRSRTVRASVAEIPVRVREKSTGADFPKLGARNELRDGAGPSPPRSRNDDAPAERPGAREKEKKKERERNARRNSARKDSRLRS